eukprot:COSAG01_NODE_71026_length_257_cov_0.645570_1_plen_31_part_00
MWHAVEHTRYDYARYDYLYDYAILTAMLSG